MGALRSHAQDFAWPGRSTGKLWFHPGHERLQLRDIKLALLGEALVASGSGAVAPRFGHRGFAAQLSRRRLARF